VRGGQPRVRVRGPGLGCAAATQLGGSRTRKTGVPMVRRLASEASATGVTVVHTTAVRVPEFDSARATRDSQAPGPHECRQYKRGRACPRE